MPRGSWFGAKVEAETKEEWTRRTYIKRVGSAEHPSDLSILHRLIAWFRASHRGESAAPVHVKSGAGHKLHVCSSWLRILSDPMSYVVILFRTYDKYK